MRNAGSLAPPQAPAQKLQEGGCDPALTSPAAHTSVADQSLTGPRNRRVSTKLAVPVLLGRSACAGVEELPVVVQRDDMKPQRGHGRLFVAAGPAHQVASQTCVCCGLTVHVDLPLLVSELLLPQQGKHVTGGAGANIYPHHCPLSPSEHQKVGGRSSGWKGKGVRLWPTVPSVATGTSSQEETLR